MTVAQVRLNRGSIDVSTDKGDLIFKAQRGGMSHSVRVKGCCKEAYRKGLSKARRWIEEGV